MTDQDGKDRTAFEALGYARSWLPVGKVVRTEDVIKELREGEEDEVGQLSGRWPIL
jgi:hypothetical protein